MLNITEKISHYVENLTYAQLPPEVIEQVKLFIADYYAACFAGYRINTSLNDKVLRLMQEMGGVAESTVLFCDQKLPASNAAFMNAVYAHGADMDDGNRKAAGHIAAHVMSAVFALAEKLKSSWEDVIVSIIAGYDVFNRIVGAGQPAIYNKGFHSTGVGGSIACAAACAKLLNLDYFGIYNAISLSAIQSSGLIIIDESGQGCKPINPANAARTGVISAQLAELGVESSENPLESKKGWFNAFGDEIDLDVLFDGLGENFTICESYLKLYPSCRHTHCCIDAALELREIMQNDGCSKLDIQSIEVQIYPSAIKSAGSILHPKNADEAKFSIHYCIATALNNGFFGLEELNVSDCSDLQDIIPKIALVPNDAMEDRRAGVRGAKMIIKTSKNIYETTVLIPKGEASKPLQWEDICKKLEQCVGKLYKKEQQHELIERIKSISPDKTYSVPII